MPYLRQGTCVFKKKPDGSKGEKVGCSDTVEEAKAYMRKLYMEENKSIAQFSMAITKASIHDKSKRTMRIHMVNSDVLKDAYEERMSTELFEDFVERIENKTSVPEPFDGILEDGWNGGMPYLSLSHYKSGGGKNVPGEVERVFADNKVLKSDAFLNESPLGCAVWESVCKDLEEKDLPLEERSFENPVRISIGFLDLQHKHEIEDGEDFVFTRTALKQKCEKCEEGINGKVYLKGQLVHLAFTRVPANDRTSVEVLRMSDEIETKKQDAESIIGDLAEELVGKSQVEDDALVVKAEEEKAKGRDYEEDDDEEKEDKKEMKSQPETEKTKSEEVMEEQVTEEVVEETPVVEETTPEKSAIDAAFETMKAKMAEIREKGIVGDEAAQALQPFMNELAEKTKEEINPISDVDKIAEVVRATVQSELEKAIPDIISRTVNAIPQQKVQEQTAEVPERKSLFLQRSNVQTPEKSLMEKLVPTYKPTNSAQ